MSKNKLDPQNPIFRCVIDGNSGKVNVEHRENGTLIDNVDSMAAAMAIAVLANMGHLSRDDYGDLCITSTSGSPDVSTMEEYDEELDDQLSDDGPGEDNDSAYGYEDAGYDPDAYGPKESAGE
jgi:hypothetical protein